MRFDENAIATCGGGGAREDGSEHAIAARLIASSTRTLHGVRGIEYDGVTRFANPIERTHVGHEIIVAKGGAALGEEKLVVAPLRARYAAVAPAT